MTDLNDSNKKGSPAGPGSPHGNGSGRNSGPLASDNLLDAKTPLAFVTAGLNAVGTILIIVLMLIVNADVIGRNFLSAPLPGVVELTEAAIVIIVFLQVGHTLRVGRFTRSDGLFGLLCARRPNIASGLEAFYSVTGAVLFAIIAWNAWDRLINAWNGGYYAGIRGAFTLPTWPIELAITIGCVVMVWQFLAMLLAALGRIRNGRAGEGAAS